MTDLEELLSNASLQDRKEELLRPATWNLGSYGVEHPPREVCVVENIESPSFHIDITSNESGTVTALPKRRLDFVPQP